MLAKLHNNGVLPAAEFTKGYQMTELGAVFAGIIIGILLMAIVCTVVFAYTRIMNKLGSSLEPVGKN